jgi:hypothetical protein
MNENYWHVSSLTNVIAYPNGVDETCLQYTSHISILIDKLGHDFRPDYANLGKFKC